MRAPRVLLLEVDTWIINVSGSDFEDTGHIESPSSPDSVG